MNIQEALEFIHSQGRFREVLSLDLMKLFMESFDNVHKKIKFIHVAGTNGKGSTVSYLTNILMEAGYKTGSYTSPFIHRFNERIKVNDVEIADKDIIKYAIAIKNKLEEMGKETKLTEFEIVTAMAFLYFYECECDVVVLEVGLGGRFDATNVIENPLVSVITTISYDHTEILGHKLSQIALEKAGIIKENCPVVIYEQQEEALEVLEKTAKEKNAKLIKCDFQTLVHKEETNLDFQTFDYLDYKDLKISLLGSHQLKNAALAITTTEILKQKNLDISEQNLRKGLLNTKWTGRFEVVCKKPIVVVDGAHNEQGVAVLAENIKNYFKDRKIVFIMGVLKDKDYEKMIEVTLPLAKKYLTITPLSPRALKSEELCDLITKKQGRAESFDSLENALDIAFLNKDDVYCVFGSLYFLGAAIEKVKSWV